MEGETDSPFVVVNYAMALEAKGGFSEARIAEIDESKPAEAEAMEIESTRVSFKIVITK